MTMPTTGRIVHYRLSDQDAEEINRRREDAQLNMESIRTTKTGYQAHVGARVFSQAWCAMIVTGVGSTVSDDDTKVTYHVNGQVFLDGNDTLWVTKVTEGDGTGQWAWPPRQE